MVLAVAVVAHLELRPLGLFLGPGRGPTEPVVVLAQHDVLLKLVRGAVHVQHLDFRVLPRHPVRHVQLGYVLRALVA
eukprot:3254861-Pyramimonas_sp.AAC.1